MVLKKQTVWLLTMLTLMVVLSAYYLFNHDSGENYDMAAIDDTDWVDSVGTTESEFDFTTYNDESNFFINYRLEREALRAEMIDQYAEVIASGETAEAIADASAKRDKIYDMADKELTLESLIRTEGFKEAVVIADTDKVSVIVKSEDSLERQQVLSIIHMVRNNLAVAGNQVFVSYR